MAPRYYEMSANVKPKPSPVARTENSSKTLPTVVVKLRLTNSSHRNETFDERELRTAPMGAASKGKGLRLGPERKADIRHRCRAGALPILWRRHQRAHGNERAVRRHLVAARRGSLGWDDREVSFGAAIGG